MSYQRCKYYLKKSQQCTVYHDPLPIHKIERKLHCQCCNTCYLQTSLYTGKDKRSKLQRILSTVEYQYIDLSAAYQQHYNVESYLWAALLKIDKSSEDLNDICSIIRDAYGIKLLQHQHCSHFIAAYEWYACVLIELMTTLGIPCKDTICTDMYDKYIATMDAWSDETHDLYNRIRSSYSIT